MKRLWDRIAHVIGLPLEPLARRGGRDRNPMAGLVNVLLRRDTREGS